MTARPATRFCESSDGTLLSYTTYGSGPPLVCVQGWACDMAAEFEHPLGRKFYDRLGERYTQIWVGLRGLSPSDKAPRSLSEEACAGDIERVVDALGLERFDLFGEFCGAAFAALYAARRPQRVRKLALWHPLIGPGSRRERERFQGFAAFLRNDWRLGLRSLADLMLPDGPVETHRWLADALQRSVDQEMLAASIEVSATADISGDLEKVAAPSLVMHRAHTKQRFALENAQEMARIIRGARLESVEGYSEIPSLNGAAVADAIIAFLDSGPEGCLPDGISARELEVLRLVAAGRTNKEIAEALTLSPHTVTRHVSNVFHKTGMKTRSEAVSYAHRMGLLRPD